MFCRRIRGRMYTMESIAAASSWMLDNGFEEGKCNTRSTRVTVRYVPPEPIPPDGNAFEDGKDAGAAEALAIWEGYEDACDAAIDPDECVCLTAWNFEDDVQDMIDSYSSPGGGAYQRAHMRGFRAGVNDVVDEKTEECFDDPDVCEGLGDLAATMIGMLLRPCTV